MRTSKIFSPCLVFGQPKVKIQANNTKELLKPRGITMSADEENCVRSIVASLQVASQQLGGTTAVDANTPQISLEEARDFLDILTSILNPVDDPERLRTLVFEINKDLVPTVVSFLATLQLTTSGDILSALTVSALKCLCRIVCACIPLATPENPYTNQDKYLSALCTQALTRSNALSRVAQLMSPMYASEVQLAAGEALFALLLRSEEARDALAGGAAVVLEHIKGALAAETTAQLRAFGAACMREVANSHPQLLCERETVSLLSRLTALDPSPDVRALAAETIDVMFKHDPQAWAGCTLKKEIATVAVGRLEQETASEAVQAVLKLTETLFVADAHLPEGLTDSTFTDYFLALFGDRTLIACLRTGGDNKVASLAARCLRLLIQMGPYYRYIGFNICQHAPSISEIIRVISDMGAAPPNVANTVLNQILRVELSIALCLILAQDPRCRQLLASQLMDQQEAASQLRASILQHLNSAAMEYYTGIGIVDVTGTFFNNPSQVKWEESMRPTRSSVEALFSSQEQRWSNYADEQMSKHPAACIPTELTPDNEARTTRLTFILLSLAAHVTFQAVLAPPAQVGGVADTAARQSDSYANYSRDTPLGIKPPQPTRTSLLRQWQTHPDEYAAIKRAAAMPQTIAPSLSSAAFYEQATALPNASSRPVSPQRTVKKAAIFTKFDCALKLCSHFAEYYNRAGKARKVIYDTTPDGVFARRQPRAAAWYAKPGMASKSWGLQQLKEGDLFYFSIPYVALSSFSLEQVRQRAVRHMAHMKSSFIITPQVAKARRWFLFDMVNHIMPGIHTTLSQLIDLFATYGDENVKFPIVMYREKELLAEGQEASLHAGEPPRGPGTGAILLPEPRPRCRGAAGERFKRSSSGHRELAVPAGPGPQDPLARQYGVQRQRSLLPAPRV